MTSHDSPRIIRLSRGGERAGSLLLVRRDVDHRRAGCCSSLFCSSMRFRNSWNSAPALWVCTTFWKACTGRQPPLEHELQQDSGWAASFRSPSCGCRSGRPSRFRSCSRVRAGSPVEAKSSAGNLGAIRSTDEARRASATALIQGRGIRLRYCCRQDQARRRRNSWRGIGA